MNLTRLLSLPESRSKAYIIGLMFPLIKKIDRLGKTYFVGGVNHNSNMISAEDLTKHWSRMIDLFNVDGLVNQIEVTNNSNLENVKKVGFSVLIEIDNFNIQQEVQVSLEKILNSSKADVIKHFIKGCFDGRSSIDNTTGFIAVDVDRDTKKQNLIADIIHRQGISVNLNQRTQNHPKNDQIRIVRTDRRKFFDEIGFLSEARKKLLIENINRLS
jgi:hypothetical protein